jgi:molybdopterin molybdotransferase
MDGFALRCADVERPSVELKVIGEIPAGKSADRAIGRGEAMAIMTGAPLPSGADAVVPVEDTERASDRVRIKSPAVSGRFIARRGSDCTAGSVVLPRGTKLEAAHIAVAASVGAAEVQVFAKPRVAILSTGDELVAIDQQPGPAQIRNSNNPMLVALLTALGCEVDDLGVARDVRTEIESSIARGLSYDALFISGGMSMGEYDLVPAALASLGSVVHITKLRIKPGKPFVYAHIDRSADHRCHIFGLPGNPVSGFACVLRLASRLLARLAGGEPEEKWIHATLDSPLPANGPREFYQPAIHHHGMVAPLPWKGSADVFTLARANVLVVRGENEPELAGGAVARCLEIPS